MKTITTLLAAIVGLAAARPTFPKLNQRAPNVCSSTDMSCPSTGGDTCCSPQHGLVAFALQWYPGFGPEDAFTLHGLWPNDCDGDHLPRNGCFEFSEHYPEEDIGSFVAADGLSERMNTYWPSYYGADNNVHFWWHEWDVHGTCVSTLATNCDPSYENNPGKNAIEFFKKVLDLRDTYNIYKALSDRGITPSYDYYYTDSVRDAIEAEYPGINVKLDCTPNGVLQNLTFNLNVQGRDSYQISNHRISRGTCREQLQLPPKY